MSEEIRKEKPATGAGHFLLNVLVAILLIVFVPVVIMNTVLIVKGALDDSRPPSVLGVTPLVVLSGEMDDGSDNAILVGDLILVRGCDTDSVEVGDILSFVQGGRVLTQRVKYVSTDGRFYTKGDASSGSASLTEVSPSAVVGEFFFRIPSLGASFLFMQSPTGMLVCVGIPLIIFIVYDVMRRQMMKRQEKVRRDPPRQNLPELSQDPDQVFLPREVLKKPSEAVSAEPEAVSEKEKPAAVTVKPVPEITAGQTINQKNTASLNNAATHKVKVIVGRRNAPAEKCPAVVKVKVRRNRQAAGAGA